MKKYLIFLFCIFLYSIPTWANEVVSLTQLGEKQKSVGDEIQLQVSKKNIKTVNAAISSIESNYILPYVYVYQVRSGNDMLFLDGIITNLNEKYKPVEINKEVILFNITNEHIDKTQMEIPQEFLFNFTNFNFTKSEILYYLFGFILLLSITSFFFLKIYPKLKLKKNWQEIQKDLYQQLMNSRNAKDLEYVYIKRKLITEMFTYNQTQFEALLSLIDRNQYMKEWKEEDLEKAKKLVHNLNFNKKKYGGN